MLKKLELDSLRADLETINTLLAGRDEEQDPVGWFQFSQRKTELEGKIAELEQTLDTEARLGLFFGGRPVYGSKGILADFAGKAIEQFQDMVSKRFAAVATGSLGASGPIPLREHSQLMITDVARGSFGFLLEEISEEHSLIDTSLRQVVGEISELVYKVSLDDNEIFDSVADTLDDRLLGSLKSFLRYIDDAGATLRIVEGPKEFRLDHDDIQRARARTEAMELDEKDKEAEGVLYIFPDAKRFELHLVASSEVIRGTISPKCMSSLRSDPDGLKKILGRECKVNLFVREVKERNRSPRNTFTMLNAEPLSR